MASRISRVCSLTRFSTILRNQNIFYPRAFCRMFSSPAVVKDEGWLQKIKKYAFGDEPPPQTNAEESYYELSRGHEPLVYNMDDREICEKVEGIVREVIPEAGDNWDSTSMDNITVKYKILSRCSHEFGILVPDGHLSTMSKIEEVLHFYRSAAPKDTRTFKSIDMDNLPPNLIIGGKVPRKEIKR